MNTTFHTYGFEKLQVWKFSISLAKKIYQLTELFPIKEQFGLTSQIRRSVNSVSSNISEGTARLGIKDRARFYQIAFSSLIETLNHLILSKEFQYLDEGPYIRTRQQIDEVAKLLNGLYKSQVKHLSEPEIPYGSGEDFRRIYSIDTSSSVYEWNDVERLKG